MYITKESNILLSFWKQILDFKHDFANLKSSTEKDLSSFKICICQNIESIQNLQTVNHQTSHEVLPVFLSLLVDFAMFKLSSNFV